MGSISETYFSIDVETDGPSTAHHSMLSLGAAAFRWKPFQKDVPKPISTFEVNIELIPGRIGDSDTMNWWKTQPKAWEAHRKDCVSPQDATELFNSWVRADKNRVLCVYPAWDFKWVDHYLQRFVRSTPFGLSCLDMKSLASGILNLSYRQTTKSRFPKKWFIGAPKHDHTALCDAIGQGIMLMRIFDDQLALHNQAKLAGRL